MLHIYIYIYIYIYTRVNNNCRYCREYEYIFTDFLTQVICTYFVTPELFNLIVLTILILTFHIEIP